MKEHEYKWKEHERKLIHFRACLGMNFSFMLDLEHADFHKTLESDRVPLKSDKHNNSNYSDVYKGFWRELTHTDIYIILNYIKLYYIILLFCIKQYNVILCYVMLC